MSDTASPSGKRTGWNSYWQWLEPACAVRALEQKVSSAKLEKKSHTKTDASAPEISFPEIPFPKIIDQEIAGFPPDVQNILEEITTIIRTASTNRPGNHQVSLPDKSR